MPNFTHHDTLQTLSIQACYAKWFEDSKFDFHHGYVQYKGEKYVTTDLEDEKPLYWLWNLNTDGSVYYNGDNPSPDNFNIRRLNENLPYGWEATKLEGPSADRWGCGAFRLTHPASNISYIAVFHTNDLSIYKSMDSTHTVNNAKQGIYDLFDMPDFLFEMRWLNFAWLSVLQGPNGIKMYKGFTKDTFPIMKPLEARSNVYVVTKAQYPWSENFVFEDRVEKYLELVLFAKEQALINDFDYRMALDFTVWQVNKMMAKWHFSVAQNKWYIS